ncbi:MAG: 50S ribosomal protein L29 [Candidatus Thermoplasmatota archaeon]|jgi:large subunit ribosomal protein L29|nr:50S ribosomal protein L29 [Candidatus Thermoplasmatota archaeon]MCL5786209.1 50S ribosomal protein L29 [Candidatus Thermoplasmatota archaeon]
MELKAKEARKMSEQELRERRKSLMDTLMKERASRAMGGAPHNPGKMGSVRREIARLNTVMAERGIKR